MHGCVRLCTCAFSYFASITRPYDPRHPCPGDGIGRRSALKTRRRTGVWVRIPPWAPQGQGSPRDGLERSAFASSRTAIRAGRWRRGPESNRPTRICNPVHNRFATAPSSPSRRTDLRRRRLDEKGKPRLPFLLFGAGEESRTLDLNLGKVALYQLSYSRFVRHQQQASIIDDPCSLSMVKT